MLKKLDYILDRKQKQGLVWLGILLFIAGLLETLGVSAIFPVVMVIMDPDALMEYEAVRIVTGALGIRDATQLVIILLGALMLIYVLKNVFLLYVVKQQTKFIAYNRNRMISRVLREFLNRPYEFYLEADIPTVFRITDADIPNVFQLLQVLIQFASEIIVAACLCVVLLVTDWKMTLSLLVVFGIITLLISKLLKPRLNRLGRKNQEVQSRIAKWRIQAIYGIKDVKVLHREEFFAYNYENTGKESVKLFQRYAIMNNAPRLLIETVFMMFLIGYILIYLLQGNDIAKLITTLSVFGVAAIRLLPCANRINTYITEIAYAEPCLNYLYENLNINVKLMQENPVIRSAGSKEKLKLQDEIRLSHITYAYPNTDKYIFRNADMVIPYSKSVGIMG
ncbi:MAG: ABC transporter ATP-binding protein, partial [Lachnospiraceae bacterium]|nr:ABC transporter ATP-binding protein [Lachnospiraceae bacterium]